MQGAAPENPVTNSVILYWCRCWQRQHPHYGRPRLATAAGCKVRTRQEIAFQVASKYRPRRQEEHRFAQIR